MTVAMEWRAVARAPRFEVSECGDLRLADGGRRLRGFIDADGYLRYALKGCEKVGAVGAHILVAEAFLGPAPSAAHEVAHENGSRLLNHHSNLRWKLPVQNHADRVAHGTDPVGERNGRAKVTSEDVTQIRREYRQIKASGSGRRVAELDERYGLSRASIIRIATGEAWSHVPMPNFAQQEI